MAAEQSIPIYTNLNELYQNLGTTLNHAERWDHLAKEFAQRFGRKPAYIARAPGRVNLIGEHIDYALFGAFPAAVERDILIACAPRSATISDEGDPSPALEPYQTSGSGQGSDAVHAEGWHLEINPKELRWESYVKAGYYGVLEHYFPPSSGQHPVPVDLLVTGTVPAGSGLSSSAAMVVASTLAFLAVNDKLDDSHASRKLTKGELVMMAMENEKRVGKHIFLDQAASVISNPGAALYITFFPSLAASPTPLPKGAVFVCANSLVVSDKAVTAKTNYNLRVVETLVGARILARSLGVQLHDTDTKKEKITYREVLGRFAGEEAGSELTVDQLTKALEGILENLNGLKSTKASEHGATGVTIDEMIDLSGLTEAEFTETYLSWIEVEATYFQLYKRAKHVFSEALRVLQFRQTCLDVSGEVGEEEPVEVLQRLGELMNESQASCTELYECSCLEIDNLTKLARQAGALGSRVTGAGWGGCTVSLVPEAIVDSFIAKVKETYGPYKDLEGDRLGEVIFATTPSSGACVYKFEE
ncbi:galactokinase [Pleurotus ostreatus]|uniref:Galactokinase n=1 Tax=Pleurotus ostreatus TaxID=5322 RepID=A0A8H6ZZE5_PLEOS|nr:galactokinase [Pleurotus ostreatus]KAF7432768.1 galactokinase [Pleurotus ostreatus]